MEDVGEIFVQRVTDLAKRRRLSVNRLADAAGVSRGYLSDVLRRRHSPTIAVVAAIAMALEVPAYMLLKPQQPAVASGER